MPACDEPDAGKVAGVSLPQGTPSPRPGSHLVRVRFTDVGQTVRGSTSVALMSDVVGIPDISGAYVGSGTITNTGSFSNGTLSIQINTQDTVGDTCTSTGSFTLTRQ